MNEFTKYPFLFEENEEQGQSIEKKLFSAAQLLSSRCDQISGLTLRHFFLDDLSRRIYEFGRYEIPVSVCLLSVEDFAPYGADEPAIASTVHGISQILEQCIRQSDIATWFSPNEFLIEMPHSTLSEAQEACLRIENTVNKFLQDRDGVILVSAEQIKAGDVPESVLERLNENLAEARVH